MQTAEILKTFREIAAHPEKQKEKYLAEGKQIVLCAPVYTPEELIHSMGLVPMGAWGADIQLSESKKYFPAFICSIVQSILESGIKGVYDGTKAIVIPSLCDSLKVFGENWKSAVKDIRFIPVMYPQNRKPAFGHDFIKYAYERVIRDLEEVTGASFDADRLRASVRIYNEHNQVMRSLPALFAAHPEVSAADRSAVFKSAWFMLKEEHTALVKELTDALTQDIHAQETKKLRIMTSGILADAEGLLKILDENDMQIVADDIAAESRQYRTDAPESGDPLDCLADKYQAMDHCSVLYDPAKKRVQKIVDDAKAADAQGVLMIMTKFCDPEEFDYPLIKRACETAGVPFASIEVDRQMVDYEQARTTIETFRDLISA